MIYTLKTKSDGKWIVIGSYENKSKVMRRYRELSSDTPNGPFRVTSVRLIVEEKTIIENYGDRKPRTKSNTSAKTNV